LFPKSEIGKQLVPTIKLLHPEDSHAHLIKIGHPREAFNLVLAGTPRPLSTQWECGGRCRESLAVF